MLAEEQGKDIEQLLNDFVDILKDAFSLFYEREDFVFAINVCMWALVIWLLDLSVKKTNGQSVLMRVGYEGHSWLSFVLYVLGAGLGAYVGGGIGLFDATSKTSGPLVGVSWPTVLPRLIAMAGGDEEEQE